MFTVALALDLLIQYHVFYLSFTCVLRLYLNKSIYKDEFSRRKIEIKSEISNPVRSLS